MSKDTRKWKLNLGSRKVAQLQLPDPLGMVKNVAAVVSTTSFPKINFLQDENSHDAKKKIREALVEVRFLYFYI